MTTTQQNAGPAARDPREIITPDAFTVAPHLLGLPLARPRRRAVAMGIDLILVAIMINAFGSVFLPAVGGVMLVRVLKPSKTGGVMRRGAVFLVGFIAVVLIVGSVVKTTQRLFDRVGNGDRVEEVRAAEARMAADSTAAAVQASEVGDEPRRNEPRGVRRMIAALADDLGIGFGWMALYFTAFAMLGRGQTPGKFLLGIRVIRLDGKPITWWVAFERFGGYAASFSTGLLGFLQILWDRNRQGLHDKAVGTVVVREITPAPPSRTTP